MQQFIQDNWYTILVTIVLIAGVALYILKLRKLPKEELYARVRAWLLQAVSLAEGTFGGGTGKLKLSTVYALFCKQVPWLAQIISFEMFSKFVDDALTEMKTMLETNPAYAAFIQNMQPSAELLELAGINNTTNNPTTAQLNNSYDTSTHA